MFWWWKNRFCSLMDFFRRVLDLWFLFLLKCLKFWWEVLVFRNSDGTILRPAAGDNRKSASPEKEDRYYTTRGSAEDTGKGTCDVINGEEKALVWPKLYITLSSKEKEEDFLAMKGCKLPQRPKKRAKIIQRSLLVCMFLFTSKKKKRFLCCFIVDLVNFHHLMSNVVHMFFFFMFVYSW